MVSLAKRELLSLYDEVKARGYEASIIATYCINFAFYERVLLRRLQSVGCRHNIVLADASQCGKELGSPSSAPQFAGAEYALLPVKAGGAFHPKFIFLVGRQKARLIVGSHNITVPGFGLSREVTTAFDIEPDGPTSSAARAVWAFVREWTTELPQDIQRLIASTERIAPWLSSGPTTVEHPILLTTPSGTSLWDQLRPRLTAPVTRVSILSPYFDGGCSFLRTIERELRPKELVVALQAKHTVISKKARTLVPSARFVDVSSLGDGWSDKRLHAKLLRFEFQSGDSLVVTGSANASSPAWLSRTDGGNAEIVVVHENGDQVWKDLGLEKLGKLPLLNEAGWTSIGDREALKKDDDKEQIGQAPYLALAAPDGFVVSGDFVKGLTATDIEIVSGLEVVGKIESLKPVAGGVLAVCTDPKAWEIATLLRAKAKRGPDRVAIIHRVGALLDRAAGTVHQAFRRALNGLQGDPEDLVQLIQLVEKIVFDTTVSVQDVQAAATKASGQQRAKPDAALEHASLMVSARDTIKGRRRRRVLATSDLALIIDALIYRLGQGLQHEDTDSSASVKVVEPGTDDEEDDRDEPDGHVLAKLCRGKVNRLFRRMIQQMEAAVERDNGFTTPIVQLAAVLGVVKHLRSSKVDWLPRGEELVDFENAWGFFKDASRILYAPELNLALKALTEGGGQEFDELTICRALLAWLALDCDLDTRTALDEVRDEPEEARENLVGIAYFLPVITECTHDEQAEAILRTAFVDQQADEANAQYHLLWAERIERAASGVRKAAESFLPGNIAIPLKLASARPSVVVDVQHNKVGIIDLGTGEPKFFAAGFLAKIQAST